MEINKIPKRKPNHFITYDTNLKKYTEVKYISQSDLAEGYRQIMPKYINKKLINHFSITLCFLPEYLWSRLKYEKDNYKVIKDGITRYTIIETNQDNIMIQLYKEIKKLNPDNLVLKYLVNELDDSLYNSWLVLRVNKYLNSGFIYKSSNVTTFYDFKIQVD